MERYVLRGGRWGYDRLQLLAQDAGVTDDGRALNPVTLEAIADAITGAGLATEAEVAAAIADLAAFAADPQTLLSGPRVFQVWARRP
jgi:hypothetical protein